MLEQYKPVLIGILIPILILILIYLIISQIQLYFTRWITVKNPTQENAWKMYKILCRPLVAIKNHPKDWGKFRDMFYQVNCSDKVQSELKQKLKERLMKKGLYINNMRIIDNYGKQKQPK